MTYIDKGKLTADRVINRVEDYEIPGVGVIKVRALSRMELMEANQRGDRDGHMAGERYTLSRAVVAPLLTEDDVAAWQAGSPGNEINLIAMKINELSGITRAAQKELYKSDGERSVA